MDNVLVCFNVIINPGRPEEETMETVSSGKIYLKNGQIYIVYSEMDEVFMDEFTGIIKIEDKEISVVRYDKKKEPFGKMEFAVGETRSGYYGTEHGFIDIETKALFLRSDVTYENGGTLTLDYEIELAKIAKTRHIVTIEIKKEKPDE